MAKKEPKVLPIGDRIVVRRVEAPEKTKGGIVLPDTAKEKPKEGVVVAVGRGRTTSKGRLIEPQLKRDDRILFGSYAGTEVRIEGHDYLILREGDVLAVID